jgi:hypothetical protein
MSTGNSIGKYCRFTQIFLKYRTHWTLWQYRIVDVVLRLFERFALGPGVGQNVIGGAAGGPRLANRRGKERRTWVLVPT